MAFVKLDTAILDSTVWIENVQRNVFITALLMAVPFEATSPMEQIEVRSLKKTGFYAPPGWYGFVHAAGVGIAGRAGIETNLALDALEIMGSEEPESRSPEFGGRRLIRVNGGYLVLNFQKYRDKDHTGAVRAMRYRQRQKNKLNEKSVTRDGNAETRDVTQAEEEAEVLTPLSPPRGADDLDQELAETNAMRLRMTPPLVPLDMAAFLAARNIPGGSGAEKPGRRGRSQ